jgi:gliding motility-associated protein GldM
MYLVLTALLALNVSKEVLNSFFEVNKGIERTTSNFDLKNGATYSEFDNAVTNNAIKFQEVRNKAYSVKDKADAIVDSLQKMKYNLVLAVDKEVYLGADKDIRDNDGNLIEDLALTSAWNDLSDSQQNNLIGHLNAKSNRDQSSSLFYDKKKAGIGQQQSATTRKDEMEDLKVLLLSLTDGNTALQNSISETFNFDDVKQDNGKYFKWEHHNFYDMPAVGALTLLSKMQSDIRNAEANVIDYLKKDIDSKSLKFGDAEGVAIPKSNFVIQGDSFHAIIFTAAKQEGQEPEIMVGNVDSLGGGKYEMVGDYETVKVVHGQGLFATRTSSEGVKKWGGLIRMKTEKGLKEYPFSGEYLVSSKQAVASPTNMNVLYRKVDNPIKIAVAGYSASQVSAVSRNGVAKPINKNKGEWSVFPSTLTNKNSPIIDLYVTVDGKRIPMGTVDFKVKKIPDPSPRAGKLRKEAVSKGELRSAQRLVAYLEDFNFDRDAVSYQVLSYTVTYTSPNGTFDFDVKQEEKLKGKFNKRVLEAITNAVVGTPVIFKNIKVKRKGVKPFTLREPILHTIK